jgi:hypothetical protein
VPARVVAAPGPELSVPAGPTRRAPLGSVFGTRSGDKGGNANLGIFARSDQAFVWLDAFLDVEKLRELLPEVADLTIDRHRLASPQAKGLGEWLRSRHVELPEVLLR